MFICAGACGGVDVVCGVDGGGSCGGVGRCGCGICCGSVGACCVGGIGWLVVVVVVFAVLAAANVVASWR